MILAALVFLANLSGQVVQADANGLTISSAPVASSDQLSKMFQPVVDLLSKQLALEFELDTARDMRDYQAKLRVERFDIVFDEAHVISKIVERERYSPLIALSGDIGFAIISRYNDAEVVALSDLQGQIICADAEPSLQATILLAQFQDSYRTPVILPVVSNSNRYQALLDSRCRASVIEADDYLPKLKQGTPRVTRILYFIDKLPRHAFAVSTDIPVIVQSEMAEVLLSHEGLLASEQLRNYYSNGRGFEPVSVTDYAGLQRLLAAEQTLLNDTQVAE